MLARSRGSGMDLYLPRFSRSTPPLRRGEILNEARHRQQELFLLVVPALDCDESRRVTIRGRGDLALRRGQPRENPEAFARWQSTDPDRWRDPCVGVARDPRISRREVSGGRTVADRSGRAGA